MEENESESDARETELSRTGREGGDKKGKTVRKPWPVVLGKDGGRKVTGYRLQGVARDMLCAKGSKLQTV